MEGKQKFTAEDLYANWVYRMLNKTDTEIIHEVTDSSKSYSQFEFRDVFYKSVAFLNSDTSIGHALCLVGLRRTGKTVLLNQLKENSHLFNINRDEILHLSLSASIDGKIIERDELDINKLDEIDDIIYPSLSELKQYIEKKLKERTIRCLLIDEITLCQELINYGKGFIDWLCNCGLKVVLAGTESASFPLANERSLYTRIVLFDLSYIPFGEYCRLKKLDISTYENKRRAIEIYMDRGNVLDDSVQVDLSYVESAVAVNLALSIVNREYEQFITEEDNIKGVVSAIVKYIKLIGDKINLSAINDSISRGDLSRAILNIDNRYNTKTKIPTKSERKELAIEAAEQFFKEYGLKFSRGHIPLLMLQLDIIDDIISKLGLVYYIPKLPLVEYPTKQIEADDLTILTGLQVNLARELSKTFTDKFTGKIDDNRLNEIAVNILETTYGRTIENIIGVQLLQEHSERFCDKKIYYDKNFSAFRKGISRGIYKYRESIYLEDGKKTMAEVDLVTTLKDHIEFIEIKHSSITDEHQLRWLTNETVEQNIITHLYNYKPIEKYVLYLGEPTTYQGIEYKNIADFLLEHYEKELKDKARRYDPLGDAVRNLYII